VALTPGYNHAFAASLLSPETIQAQAAVGNITQDDAVLAISLVDSEANGALEAFSTAALDLSSGLNDFVIQDIQAQAGPSERVLDLLGVDVDDWLRDFLTPNFDLLHAINSSIESFVADLRDEFLQEVINLSQAVMTGVNGVVSDVTTLANRLDETVLGPVVDALGDAQNALQAVDGLVKETIRDGLAPVIATTDKIVDEITGFATALGRYIPELGETLGGAFGKAGDVIGDAVKGAFTDFISSTGLGGIKPILDALSRIGELVDPQDAYSPSLIEKMGGGTLEEFLKNPPAMVLQLIPFINNLAGIVFGGQVERVQQASRGDANSGLIPISDMVSLEQRGEARTEEVNETAFRHGLNTRQVDQIHELVRLRPGTQEILDYWRRKLITPQDADVILEKLGWSNYYRELLKDAAYPPPGVQDLIRMSVREVFSPEVAERFGQFDEIPQVYLEWGEKIGLSEEWARNFWAAHWMLPSVQQGFEMLHRGVIEAEDLERLFVAQDIMPFWRDKISAISYRPYTRVDVRRMYALGTLDAQGVLTAYKDIGFDDDKAAKMTDFTIKWVDSSRKVEREKERDLTKSDIIGLYNDGLIEAPAAKNHLLDMGYDANEAELLIQREVIQELRTERKADIKLIVDQAKIRTLTFQQAQDRLHGLDLTKRELDKAVLEITRATSEKVRMPSKADLDGWQELRLITLDEYATELDSMGYPSKYVALYVEAVQLEEAEDLLAAEEREARKAEPRPVSKSQLDSLLRSDIIDTVEYSDALALLRFDPAVVDDFVAQISIEIEEKRIAAEERAARGEEAAEEERLLSRVVLGKMLIKELIPLSAYQEGLRKLGFNSDSVELLTRLISAKLVEAETEE